jgi:hypothetical protein
MKSVLIVDNQKARFRALVEVISQLPNTAIYTYSTGLNKLGSSAHFKEWNTQFKDWDKCEKPDEVTLFLIHGRDYFHKDVIDNYGKRIWYGGFTGNDPQAPEGEDSIKRVIERDEGILTVDEAKQLLNYASEDSAPKPKILTLASYNPKDDSVAQLLQSLMNLTKEVSEDDQQSIAMQFKSLKSYINDSANNVKRLVDEILECRKSIDTIYHPEYMKKLRQLRRELLNKTLLLI